MRAAGEEEPGWRWFLPTLLLSTAGLKCGLAWIFPGFLTGDDLEIVETAAKYAVGLDYAPSGIRSMLHPLLLAWPCVELGVLCGLSGPHWLSFLACAPTILFSTAGIGILHRLAREMDWSPAASRVAAFLFAVHWLPLGYGATQFPRPISTALLLGAFFLAGKRSTSDADALAAGALAAAAMAVRWSEAVMLIPLAVFAFWRAGRARAPLAVLAGFLAAALLLIGLLDAWTWGRPFASLGELVRLSRDPNLGGFRPRPWFWYGSMLLQWAGPLFVLLLAASWPDRRSRAPIGIALAAVVLLSISPLKQMRYLQIAVPFLAMAAALGWERLGKATPPLRWMATAGLVLAAPLGLERTMHLLRGKSEAALAAARVIARLDPPVRRVTLEQMWAYGEKLYLGNAVEIRDLAPLRPPAAETVRAAAAGSDAVALYASDVDAAVSRALFEGGFRPCATFERSRSPAVVLYLSGPRSCPVS